MLRAGRGTLVPEPLPWHHLRPTIPCPGPPPFLAETTKTLKPNFPQLRLAEDAELAEAARCTSCSTAGLHAFVRQWVASPQGLPARLEQLAQATAGQGQGQATTPAPAAQPSQLQLQELQATAPATGTLPPAPATTLPPARPAASSGTARGPGGALPAAGGGSGCAAAAPSSAGAEAAVGLNAAGAAPTPTARQSPTEQPAPATGTQPHAHDWAAGLDVDDMLDVLQPIVAGAGVSVHDFTIAFLRAGEKRRRNLFRSLKGAGAAGDAEQVKMLVGLLQAE